MTEILHRYDDYPVSLLPFHCGNPLPDCSATMYAAYHSGQFASRWPGALFVLAVGGLRAAKCARQIVCRSECRSGAIDAPGQPGCDLLKQPPVAVRIGEGSE